MAFPSAQFSFSVGVPTRGPSQFEAPLAYQTVLSSIPRYPTGADIERAEEEIAEELKLRLHLDSLPLPRSVRLTEYIIPSSGIRWDIIDRNISKMLGEEAYLWNTYSRPDSGYYTIYATRPLTISQINDLKAWSAHANEEDEITANIARKLGKLNEEYRAKERELIRLERAEREARDRDRWRREKVRRDMEREIAWEERIREEKRRYFRQKAIAEEEFRRAERLKDRLRRMNIDEGRDDASIAAEDDENIPDESEWRRAHLIRRQFATKSRWGHGEASSKKKQGWKSNSRVTSTGCCTPLKLQDALVNLQWEVRIAPRVYVPDD